MIIALEALIKALKKLPGVGEKTATRYAFYFLNTDAAEIQGLIAAIREVKKTLRLCSNCFNLTDVDPCVICSDPKRDTSRICVVETPLDLMAIEKAGHFRGVYHVLHGALSPLDAIGPGDIRIRELVQRVRDQSVKETILALNPTVEGEATIVHVTERLRGSGTVVTRIAYGIPVGGTLEFADPLTLSRALDNRQEV
jgi:recombination protein RecR